MLLTEQKINKNVKKGVKWEDTKDPLYVYMSGGSDKRERERGGGSRSHLSRL